GTIQSMAIDETRGLLYVTNQTSVTGTVFQGRVSIIDVDPASPTFHQVLQHVVVPGNGTVLGVAVNSVTNKVYVGVTNGTANGVNVLDGATRTLTTIASTNSSPHTIVVTEATNLVYAITNTTPGVLYTIDGVTDPRLAALTLPASSAGTADTRLALHKGTQHVYVRLRELP